MFLTASLLPGSASAQTQLHQFVFGHGGGLMSNGTMTLESTFGQSIIDATTFTPFLLDAGYWAALPGPTTDVESESPVSEFALSPNQPNPFSQATRIRFALPHSDRVSLRVYDTRGGLVRTLADGFLQAG